MKKRIRKYVTLVLLVIGCMAKAGISRAAKLSAVSETMQWQEVSLKLPKEWQDLYVSEESAEQVCFYQKSSYGREQAESMGFLFSILRSGKPLYDLPGAVPLAYTQKNMYYMLLPTDVCYDYEDEQIAGEYVRLASCLDQIKETVRIDAEDVHENPEEYVMPMSEYYQLKKKDLVNLTDNTLFLARNEIYARHGYFFQNQLLRLYFKQCSYYHAIPRKDFKESELSEIEKANIKMIRKMERNYKKEYPYPVEKQNGTAVKADLDGDGDAERISYLVKGQKDGSFRGILAVNGAKYNLEDFKIFLDDPDQEHFYITDIDSFRKGLELAITDNGPSEDPVTYFFRYDGTLQYLGAVGGYPMKQKSGWNGFCQDGFVLGTVRMDFIESTEAVGYWWYDYEKGKLKRQKRNSYYILPSRPHRLLVDLPVYAQMDESSMQTTVKAQKQVYFTATDGKKWILVKAKDRSSGYIHLKNGKITSLQKAPEKVFQGLGFYD